MVDKTLRLERGPETNPIILDIGLTYTKCGISREALPQHIVPTQLSFISQIRDSVNKTNSGTFVSAFQNVKKLRLELEEFLTYVFYHLLQLNPKDQSVVILESLMSPRALIDSIAHVLFKCFHVKSVFFFLTNAMPLYSTGLDTGIIVECGFQQAQVLPIVRSRLCTEALEVSYSACGIQIEKRINENLVADNKEFITVGPGMVSERGMPLFNFPKDLLEDIKVRSLVVMQRDQRDEYMESEQSIQKMKQKRHHLVKQYKDFNNLKISFFTRYATMEQCFGDPTEEEPNIAYSILQSVKKLNLDNRRLAVQNVVLSGGSCMMPGFKTRLVQEIKHLLTSLPEFEEIKAVVIDNLKINETCVPPNCMAWMGASLLSQLNSEIDKFEVTRQDYIEKYNEEYIPDRFGEAYFFGIRRNNDFNSEFEDYFRIQKNMMFSSTTAYSTRAYFVKTPISSMLQKSMVNMKYND